MSEDAQNRKELLEKKTFPQWARENLPPEDAERLTKILTKQRARVSREDNIFLLGIVARFRGRPTLRPNGFTVMVLNHLTFIAEMTSHNQDPPVSEPKTKARKSSSSYARRIKRRRDTDRFLMRIGYLVPRRNREAALGDILEDVQEMRKVKLHEWYIRFAAAKALLGVAFHALPVWFRTTILAWIVAKVSG